MDLNKFGFAVGVLALFLAVPLAVIANLLTPKFQAWYSTTSLNRVNKRIIKLDSMLRLSEASWTFTPGEWELYQGGYRRLQSILFGIMGLFYIIAFFFELTEDIRHFLGGAIVKVRFLPVHDRIILTGLVVGAAMLLSFSAISLMLAGRKSSRDCYLHTDIGRRALRMEIERLTDIKKRYEA